MKNIVVSFMALTLCVVYSTAQENPWKSSRPDGNAPISIMGDHYHKKGGFMFSYRYMAMAMSGCLKNDHSIRNEEVISNYMATPIDMFMQMHMLGVMYAPIDRMTLMLMGNYIQNSMDLTTKMGMDFKTSSGGFGDVSFGALIKIINKSRQSLHANIGTYIPAGNIDQRDDTPMMQNAQLAYPMQLGSGSFDPFAGLTYNGQIDRFSWGAQAIAIVRSGDNKEDYKLGNQLNSALWGAIKASDWISFSVAGYYRFSDKISGADKDMIPMMMPLFNTNNSGRNALDLGIGMNLRVPKDAMQNLRIGIEAKVPVYQFVNGIQMKQTMSATIGIKYGLGHNHCD